MQNLPLQSPPVMVPTDLLTRTSDRLQTRLRAADGAEGAKRDADLKKASQEFESIFIAYLLKVMRDTIEESGLTEGGFGKGIYTELFDQEMSRGIAQHGALGIAELIYKRLSNQALVPEIESATKPRAEGSPRPTQPPSPPPDQIQEEPESEIPDFRLPVLAPISSGYGIRKDPFSHELRFHKGIDLAVPEGTEVHAARGGEVVFAGYDRGYGNTVVIQHPEGFQTRYAHLQASSVKAGDNVAEEQLLGFVGNTGRSTGPHLHFEVSRYGEQIDPKSAMTE